MSAPLLLVDGSSYLFRAYHALPPLTAPDGRPTGAIYGVWRMLQRDIKRYTDAQVVVVFDSKGKTTRHEWYPDYKANRAQMPEDLAVQIAPLHHMIESTGLPLLMRLGLEADDIIATLVAQARQAGRSVVISTGDKDLTQLVEPSVLWHNTMTGVTLDEHGVYQKFGVRPDQMVDYLALVGDSVDNIPGIPGVGPKTAAKWLSEYQTLENLLAHREKISGKVGERLREHREALALSKKIVTLDTNLSLGVTLAELQRKAPDREALREAYQMLGFKLDPELEKEAAASDHSPVLDPLQKRTWVRLESAQACAEVLSQWPKALTFVHVGFHPPLNSTVESAQVLNLDIAWSLAQGDIFFSTWRWEDFKNCAAMVHWWADADFSKIGVNVKQWLSFFLKQGLKVRGLSGDILLEAYLLYDRLKTSSALELAVLEHLSGPFVEDPDGLSDHSKEMIETVAALAHLHAVFAPRLKSHEALEHLYHSLDLPVLEVLAQMEAYGVLFDVDLLKKQSAELELALLGYEAQAHAIAGEAFNLNSPKQLQDILFDRLSLPVIEKTPKGQPSTSESVLSILAQSHELPAIILEYRTLAKLKSTYTDRLPRDVDPHTGRVHTTFHATLTSTGRLSSSDPNLQNIPVRTQEGRKIRRALVAPKGSILLSADYSQIELRVMAHCSQDPRLREAFEKDLDIHRATASELWGVALEDVDNTQRRAAKAINFGLIYGMSAFGLARQLGCERVEAELYMQRYFERYPGVQAYMNETREKAKTQGYVETLWGRRIYFPDLKAKQHVLRQAAERAAINAPLQGTAADLMKRAMIDIAKWCQNTAPQVHMILQVHDELLFEIPIGFEDQAAQEIRHRMEQAIELSVPLKVDVGIGPHWDAAHR